MECECVVVVDIPSGCSTDISMVSSVSTRDEVVAAAGLGGSGSSTNALKKADEY